MEKCWKKVDAVDGSSSALCGVVAVRADMLLSIQACSGASEGRGQSAFLYGAKTGAELTAANEPRKAAGEVRTAEVRPKPPCRRCMAR